MPHESPAVHLNPNVADLGVSATVAINDRSDALRREGREIFKLGLGESPFPVPDLVVEALREAAPEKRYLPVKGLPAVREAVADHHRREFGFDRDLRAGATGRGAHRGLARGGLIAESSSTSWRYDDWIRRRESAIQTRRHETRPRAASRAAPTTRATVAEVLAAVTLAWIGGSPLFTDIVRQPPMPSAVM